MLMVWFLVTLVGVSLVLSLLDRPPVAVSVPLFESGGKTMSPSAALRIRMEVVARSPPEEARGDCICFAKRG